MQLSIEQLYKKINEVKGILELSKQKDNLEREYDAQMQALKAKEVDLSAHLVDEQLRGEYMQKLMQIESKSDLLKFVADFNKAFAKYGNIQIDPELVGEANNQMARLSRQSKIMAAITDSVDVHNAECSKQNVLADKRKIELPKSKKQIDSISSKIQELKSVQSSKEFEEEIHSAAKKFLDSVAILHENMQSLPKSMSEDLKNFIKQMHKEHSQEGRVFDHIKKGKLEAEASKIEKMRAVYDLYAECRTLKNTHSGLSKMDNTYSSKARCVDNLLEEMEKKFLNIKLENISEDLIVQMKHDIELLQKINSVINVNVLTKVELLDDEVATKKTANMFLHAVEYIRKRDFGHNLQMAAKYFEEFTKLSNEEVKANSELKDFNGIVDNLKVVCKVGRLPEEVVEIISQNFTKTINELKGDKKSKKIELLMGLLKQATAGINQQKQAVVSVQELEIKAEADYKELSQIRDICIAFENKSGQNKAGAYAEFMQSVKASEKFKQKYQNYFSKHEELLQERLDSLKSFMGGMDSMSDDQVLAKVVEMGLFNNDDENRREFIAAMRQTDSRAAYIKCIKKEIDAKIMPINGVLDSGRKTLLVINTTLDGYKKYLKSTDQKLAALDSKNKELRECNSNLNDSLDKIDSYQKTFKFFIKNLFSFGWHGKDVKSTQADILHALNVNKEDMERDIDKKRKLVKPEGKMKSDRKVIVEKQQLTKPVRDFSPGHTNPLKKPE